MVPEDVNKTEETPIIERYAQAEFDAKVLHMVLKSYVDNPETLGMGIDQTILRSIRRAEEEVAHLRHQYEQEGKR